jgi:hypothetical protein
LIGRPAFAAAETGSPSPAQAFRLAARPFGSTARSSRVENPGWVEAGRPAGAIAPERHEVRRWPGQVANGEAEVAQRGFVGVDAQDFCGSRGALKCEAGAQRAGSGRIGAQGRVEQGEPGAGGGGRAIPGVSLGLSWLARASRAAR